MVKSRRAAAAQQDHLLSTPGPKDLALARAAELPRTVEALEAMREALMALAAGCNGDVQPAARHLCSCGASEGAAPCALRRAAINYRTGRIAAEAQWAGHLPHAPGPPPSKRRRFIAAPWLS